MNNTLKSVILLYTRMIGEREKANKKVFHLNKNLDSQCKDKMEEKTVVV